MEEWEARQAAAVAPVILVFYAIIKAASESTQLIQVPRALLLALAVVFGLAVSLYMPSEGLISLVATLVLGYGLHKAGYLSTLSMLLVVGAHLAGLAIAILRSSELNLAPRHTPRRSYTSTRSSQTLQQPEGGHDIPPPKPREPAHDPAKKILEALYRFKPIKVRDEEDLEKQLYQYLTATGFKVERQPQITPGLRPDLKIGNCILEIKIPRRREDLQRLLGQAEDYLEHKKCLIVYILYTGAIPLTILERYKHKLEEKGARVVVKSI